MNSTCDVVSFPADLRAVPGVPETAAFGSLKRRNDTLAAMEACCKPNPVHMASESAGSDDNCILWCEVDAELTFREWIDCVYPYFNDEPPFPTIALQGQLDGAETGSMTYAPGVKQEQQQQKSGDDKEGAATAAVVAAARPTVIGVAAAALLVSRLFA